jgi:hypothetical protein
MQVIEISYKSGGQVGEKPRKLRVNEEFAFVCNDEGDLTLKFLDNSPLSNGSKNAKKGMKLKAENAGRFAFKCVLVQDGEVLVLGDPNVPDSPAGGEIEVGPE